MNAFKTLEITRMGINLSNFISRYRLLPNMGQSRCTSVFPELTYTYQPESKTRQDCGSTKERKGDSSNAQS